MVTICVHLRGIYGLDDVKRILGAHRVYRRGDHWYANVSQREEYHLMVTNLNCIHGVQARVLEVGDGDRQPG